MSQTCQSSPRVALFLVTYIIVIDTQYIIHLFCVFMHMHMELPQFLLYQFSELHHLNFSGADKSLYISRGASQRGQCRPPEVHLPASYWKSGGAPWGGTDQPQREVPQGMYIHTNHFTFIFEAPFSWSCCGQTLWYFVFWMGIGMKLYLGKISYFLCCYC